ncbi:UDP-2,4-diacetamido-2,4,6-trideoxy-beta-L-altropyranose hydrolase [Lysinibacillus irui]|uniref:UDP-2,4-diacetamido-2,4, 6-trideoxy-beta-L-altropyranose hydrolase n=1 Tax=Lysinibacillus irui TaxID=2998077 RepID=UPI003D2729D9
MNVFIRVDSSFEIGTGHVMRCLTLAHRLEKQGNTIAFICRSAEGDCIDFIIQQGYHVFKLPTNDGSLWTYVSEQWEKDAKETIEILRKNSVEKLIIDHYSIDIKWENKVRPFTKKIMVIDDLANREHDCDILLDQNYYLNMDNRYKGLVPSTTRLLLGPRYALLREEFIEAKKISKTYDGKIERLFIFFGGSDPTNETEKILNSIMPLIEKYNFEVDVVVGNSNQNKKRIKDISFKHKNINFYCQINNIAEIMAKADLAIGAGGATIWERVFLGLPSIVISIAKNQVEVAKAVANKGAIIYLGFSNEVNGKQVLNILELLNKDSDILTRMRESCFNLIS